MKFHGNNIITYTIIHLTIKRQRIIGESALVKVKVKVVLYTFVHRGVPVGGDTYPESSAGEVVWQVAFLAAFISPVLPPGIHLLLDEQ